MEKEGLLVTDESKLDGTTASSPSSLMNKPLGAPYHLSVEYLTGMTAIGGFLFGYDTGIISGALLLINEELGLDEKQSEVVVAITGLGAFFTSLVTGRIADMYGRKPVVMASSAVFILGALLIVIADSFEILVLGRLVLGLAVGAASMSLPLFIGEIAPRESRGVLTSCMNLAITGGQLIACIVAGLFSLQPQNAWRYMFAIAAVPAVIQVIGFLFIPESQRWLASEGFLKEAELALRIMRPVDYDCTEELVELKLLMESTKEERELERGQQVSSDIAVMTMLFTEPTVYRALLLGCALQVCQQTTGINTIMYYSATILELAGFDMTTAIWLAVVASFFNFTGTICGLFMVDSFGRRPLTLTSLFFSTVGLGLIAMSFLYAATSSKHLTHPQELYNDSCQQYDWCFDCLQNEACSMCEYGHEFTCVSEGFLSQCASRVTESCPIEADKGVSWIILAALCFYMFVFSPGMGPMPWTINAEIYPIKVRGVGISIATSVNWLGNFVVSVTFLTIIMTYGFTITFLMYAAISVLFFIFFYRYLPETKGLSLESVTQLFTDSKWGAANKEGIGIDLVLVKLVAIMSFIYIVITAYNNDGGAGGISI